MYRTTDCTCLAGAEKQRGEEIEEEKRAGGRGWGWGRGFVTRVAWLGDKRVFTSGVWVYVVVRLVL